MRTHPAGRRISEREYEARVAELHADATEAVARGEPESVVDKRLRRGELDALIDLRLGTGTSPDVRDAIATVMREADVRQEGLGASHAAGIANPTQIQQAAQQIAIFVHARLLAILGEDAVTRFLGERYLLPFSDEPE